MADRNELYGAGLQYPFSWDASTGGLSRASDVESVRASLRRLFDTMPGEETFDPRYGSSLHTLLFEGDTEVLRALVETEVRESVARWEPRIQEVVEVLIEQGQDPNSLVLKVSFVLIQDQQLNNFVYPFRVGG